ncbi:MAG: leucyl aminopeptidase family protein [Gammaproteobacteria bacterium]|nr:leucyl aminopeptidase family protein [Gammaproteobacteria bacterium]
MPVKLPVLSLPKLSVSNKPASQTAINKLDHIIVVIADSVKPKLWKDLPYGSALKQMYEKADKKNPALALSSHLPNRGLTGVSLGVVQKNRSAFKNLTQMRHLCSNALAAKAENIGLFVLGFSHDTHKQLCEDLVAAAYAASFKLWHAKSKTNKSKIKSLALYQAPEGLDVNSIKAEAAGNNLARWLTALPPNVLNSRNYVELTEALAKRKRWQFRFHSIMDLKKLGAEAFLAVAQGNPHEDAGIVHLSYTPSGRSPDEPADLALVGKGICFDTGGTNLKPANYMLGMQGDMGGSATALGSLYALSQLKSDLRIDCWLAITENHIDAHAYKPNDVVTASNGTSIEVIHSDAEGRMALADTLAMCSKTKPKLILDYATLTGAAVYSVTTRYSCVFTNRPQLHNLLVEHGAKTGERVWPFPQDEDYDTNLESKVADTLQCSTKPGGDHILAARFLNKFVDNRCAWVHMDLSASENEGGLAHIPSKQTGFGVRYTTRLIEQSDIMNRLK